MHDPPLARIERIAPVHYGPVVPEHNIADLPMMVPCVIFARRISPDLVEQRFGCIDWHSHDIGVQTPSQIEDFPSAFRMNTEDRVYGPDTD